MNIARCAAGLALLEVIQLNMSQLLYSLYCQAGQVHRLTSQPYFCTAGCAYG
jgi:hypothetical protein